MFVPANELEKSVVILNCVDNNPINIIIFDFFRPVNRAKDTKDIKYTLIFYSILLFNYSKV